MKSRAKNSQQPNLKLGLRANLPQFVLFSVLTLWIGWFLGMERVVVPLLAKDVFFITSFILIMSFIASFGFTKAVLNLLAGRWSDSFGRKRVLIVGWIVGLPVPFILLSAPAWSWVVLANVLMGSNQALTWTMTVTSKLDIVGANNRALALGVNEFSGYIGQASGGVITGFLAAYYGLRPYPFYFGLASVFLGLVFSLFLAKETSSYALLESKETEIPHNKNRSFFDIFAYTSWRNRTLFACNQAGLVEKFTDTLVWGLYPLFLIAHKLDIVTVGLVIGIYQGVWGSSQLITGALSDRVGRKPPIIAGMWLMSFGILFAAYANSVAYYYLSSFVTGFGMALVYPVLMAGVADVVHPEDRGVSLGIYRFWRDSGYGFAALFIGVIADVSGITSSFYFSAAIVFASGWVVLLFMRETRHRKATVIQRK
jgi:MFS family permease